MDCINIKPFKQLQDVVSNVKEYLPDIKMTFINGRGGCITTDYIKGYIDERDEGVDHDGKLDVVVVMYATSHHHGGSPVRRPDVHTAIPVEPSLCGAIKMPLDKTLFLGISPPYMGMPNMDYSDNEIKSPYTNGVIGEAFLDEDSALMMVYVYYDYLSIIPDDYWIETLAFTIKLGISNAANLPLPKFNQEVIKVDEDMLVMNSIGITNKLTDGALKVIEDSEKEIEAMQQRIAIATRKRMEAQARLYIMGVRKKGDEPKKIAMKALEQVKRVEGVKWAYIDGEDLVFQTDRIVIPIDDADIHHYVEAMEERWREDNDYDEDYDEADYYDNWDYDPNEGREYVLDEHGDIVEDENGDPTYEDGNPHIDQDEYHQEIIDERNDDYHANRDYPPNYADEFTDGVVDLGMLRVRVNLSGSGSVTFQNIKKHGIGLSGNLVSHPHDMGNGRMCLGDLSGILPQLANKFQFEDLAELVMSFARSANIADEAGVTIMNWEIIDEDELKRRTAIEDAELQANIERVS